MLYPTDRFQSFGDVPTRPLFEAFAFGLRTGEMSVDTWQRVMDHCSEIKHIDRLGGSRDEFDRIFRGSVATHYFTNHADRADHNARQLYGGGPGHPVVRINAVNSSLNARSANDDDARHCSYSSRRSVHVAPKY